MKKNLISVLKKFFNKLSGLEPEGSNLVEVIDNAADNIQNNNSNSSNGNNGADVFMVNFTAEVSQDSGSGGNDGGKSGGSDTKSGTESTSPESALAITTDKTIPEIIEAYRAGKIVRGRLVYVEGESDGGDEPFFPKAVGQKNGTSDPNEEEVNEDQVTYLELYAIYPPFNEIKFHVIQQAVDPAPFDILIGEYGYAEVDEELVYMSAWNTETENAFPSADGREDGLTVQTYEGEWELDPKLMTIYEEENQASGCYTLNFNFYKIANAFSRGANCIIINAAETEQTQVLSCYDAFTNNQRIYSITAFLNGELVTWTTTNPSDTSVTGLTRPLPEQVVN